MPLSTKLDILYIEDDLIDQQFFLRTLKKSELNTTLTTAGGIEEGISLSKSTFFDLVFCDFNLPDGSALDFLENCNANETPTVVITSEADLENATESLKNGAFDFIVKDQVNVAALTRIINNIIRFKLGKAEEEKLRAQIAENFSNTKAIIDNTHDGIWSINKDGKLLIISKTSLKRFKTNFGYEAAIGDDFFKHLPKDILLIWKRLAEESLDGTPSISVDKYTTNVGEFYLEVSCSPIRSNNEITGVTFFARDVSERERNEQLIREREQSFRAIFEGSSLPILIENLETNIIVNVNEACAALHKYSKEEMIGMSISDTIPPDHRETANANYEAFLKGEVNNLDSYAYCADESIIPVHISIAEIDYRDSKCNLLFLTDLTLRNQAREKLRKAKEIAEENDKFKSSFLATMSHEIRTPMSAVIGFTDLLKKTKLNTEQHDFVEIIENSGKNLLVIINDILDLSKIQASKMELRPDHFNLHETLTRIGQLHSYKIDERGLIYNCLLSENVPTWVYGDEARIYQVLNNLINNAIKFTNEGEVSLTVEAKQIDFENYALNFSVKDTGIGIPQHQLNHIFSDFSQVDSSLQRKQQGTGLGLSIVHGLISLMGGTISVDSELNSGSEFTVTLPLKIGQPIIQTKADDQAIIDELSGKKILVCEDNEVNCLLIRKLLGDFNVELTFCHNGKDAVNAVKTLVPDIVFMDIQMPIMDGYEATNKIRSFSSVPIIAMSAHVMADEREKCLEHGMNGFLSKPFKTDDFIRFLNLKVHPQPNEPSNKWKKLDLQELENLAEGDDAFVEKILSVYIKNAEIDLAAFIHAGDQSDFERQGKIAHKFRSSFQILGLDELCALSVKIESKIASEVEKHDFISKVGASIELIKTKLAVFKKA